MTRRPVSSGAAAADVARTAPVTGGRAPDRRTGHAGGAVDEPGGTMVVAPAPSGITAAAAADSAPAAGAPDPGDATTATGTAAASKQPSAPAAAAAETTAPEGEAVSGDEATEAEY